ncbi:MAG: glycosyltransferase family 9 protein, partial [Victivallales bacterium]|nr:glycosyltransferase family 9 protein [Victivallales bacterium]
TPNATQVGEMGKMLSLVTGGGDVDLAPVARSDIKSIIDCSIADKLEKPYVVFVPGAGANCRRWPVERFAQVAAVLKRNIVVVGTKDEAVLGEAIPRAVNLCGKTSLSQLGGILAGADLVVANETGTATYAAVIGARTLCLVGGGDFKAFFPNEFYKNTRSIYHHDSCFSCMWNCSKTDLSRRIAPCVDAISAEEVCEAALGMLS